MSRGGHVARERWGEPCGGILVTERYSAYHCYPGRWRQGCGAHVLRDFAARRGRGGGSEEIGNAWLAQAHPRFAWGQRGREGTLTRSPVRFSMRPIRRAVARRGEVGSPWGVPKTAGPCRDILTRREALWTFVQVAGVAPTTHRAERSSRPGVRWRQGSFGRQSAEGARCVESMLSGVATWKHQPRNVLEYLPAVCDAALRGDAAPALLPANAQKSQAAA
jgi:transposase